MPVDLSAVRAELLTGSYASLYSANILLGDYNAVALTLNTPGLTGSSLVIGTATAYGLTQLVVAQEYLTLSLAQRDLWTMLITAGAAGGGVAISNTLIRGQIGAVWSASTTTRANIIAAETRFSSRGENLGGEGAVISVNDIYVALTS